MGDHPGQQKCDAIELAALKSRLARQGALECRIVSDSMRPLIDVEESIRVEPTPDLENIQKFDILVFLQNSKLTCHFVWGKGTLFGNTLWTRSLKEPCTDDLPIPFEHVLGKVADRRLSSWSRFSILFRNWFSRSK